MANVFRVIMTFIGLRYLVKASNVIENNLISKQVLIKLNDISKQIQTALKNAKTFDIKFN